MILKNNIFGKNVENDSGLFYNDAHKFLLMVEKMKNKDRIY